MISLEFQFGSPTQARHESNVQDIAADDMVYDEDGNAYPQSYFDDANVQQARGGSPMASVPSMASPTFSVSYGQQGEQPLVDGAMASEAGSVRKPKATFRQTTSAVVTEAMPAGTQQSFTIGVQPARLLMHRPILSREFPVPHISSIGVLSGFVQFLLLENTVRTPKEPCVDTVDEMTYVLLLTEEERKRHNDFYTEDEVTNTIILAPSLLIAFLLIIVIYCDIIVFWAPGARLYTRGAFPWTGGAIFAIEGILPLVLTLLYIIAVTYANTLKISFAMFERQFAIEPEVLQSLHGREVFLGNQAISTLCDANLPGHIPFVRRSISRKVRWYQRENYDTLPADLYATYMNSLAAYTCAVEYRRSFAATLVNFFAPALVAAAPLLARLFTGGSLWADGLAETFALVFCGFFLSYVSAYSLLSMLNLFDFTMRFHRYRMKWLTTTLPDPTRPIEDAWPMIPFHNMENVLVWHRLRSVLLWPPMALYTWGRRLTEATFLAFVIYIGATLVFNLVTRAPIGFDPSTSLTIALLITIAPFLLHILFTPLRFTFESTEEHEDVLSRILLLSLKNAAVDRISGAGASANAHIAEIRSSIKVITRSITTEESPITFLGLPLCSATFVLMGVFFVACGVLIALRGVFIPQKFL